MLTQRNGKLYLVDRDTLRRQRWRLLGRVLLGCAVLGALGWWWLRDDGSEAEAERRVIPNAVGSERDGVAESEAVLAQRQAQAEQAQAAEALARQPSSYIVRPGDTLGTIARRHGCALAAVRAANRLRGDLIHEGQALVLPGSCERRADPSAARSEARDGDAAPAPSARRGASWQQGKVDTTTLPALMAKHGFDPPSEFKAFVIEITFDASRRVVTRERAFDWKGTSDDVQGWNAASTVKLFAAIAALERVESLGFASSAEVTFHGRSAHTTTVRDLIREAIVDSDNIAYNRLVQLAGFDFLHERFLSGRNGLRHTGLMRPYAASDWAALGESDSLRDAPKLTLRQAGRSETLEASHGDAPSDCGSAACTSLQDLAEATRRLMLQEQLAASEHFGLERDDLIMLRQAMRAERARGNNVIDAFAEAFSAEGVRFYSKPGFSKDWFSDNVYIFDPRVNRAWIVAMAGYPGRKSLDEAARVLGRVIAGGELAAAP